MAYVKQTWVDDVTIIDKARMDHIEDGIFDGYDYNNLINKPTLNGKPIDGAMTTTDLTLVNGLEVTAAAPNINFVLKSGSTVVSTASVDASVFASGMSTTVMEFENKIIDATKNDIKNLTVNNMAPGTVLSAFQATPDDSHLASEKLVKDTLDGKVEIAQGIANAGKTMAVDASGNVVAADVIDLGTF